MARFYGKVGYATRSQTAPGVWSATITERSYYGKYLNATVSDSDADKVNVDTTLSSRISIVADPFALGNYRDIKYVLDGDGVYWSVTSRQLDRPRLILSTGGVYDGVKPVPAP